jgi:hypothetical protein
MPTVRAGDLPYQAYQSEEPTTTVPSAYENIKSTPADFGETIGAATERLGTVIGQGANVLAEGAIARQQLENQVRADDQTNKYQEAVTKLLHGDPDNPSDTGFLGKRGENAMRDYNSTYKSIVDLRNTMRGQLANDRQRLAFDNESRRTQILTLSRMGEHYDREFKAYGTAVNHAAALGGMTQAADAQANGDQAGFDAGVAKRMTADLKQAQLMGVANDPDVVNNILRNARSDVTKLQFKELSETNPYKAWQFLEVNKDALEPGELHTLRQSIAAKYYDLRGKIDSKEMPAPEGWDSKAPFPVRQVHPINTADPVEHFLGLAELHESAGRNILQNVVGPQGGYNPSVGRVTGPSSAQGYFQITNSTWKDFAPNAGVDLSKYPNALSAPYEVQKAVARNIVTTSGVQHWTNYNSGLRQAVAFAGLPTSGPISGGVGPTSVAPASQAGTPANIDMAFGDSNAQLATNHGVPGKEDTVVGEQPSDTLARMVARGKDYFAGKNVIMSGPTNNPDDVASVEKQAAFLQSAKARFVLPGVGPGIPGGKEKADLVNAQLAGIAQKYGGVFVMPDNWQSKDNYHIAQVPKFLEKAKAALGGGGGVPPQVTGRGAPAPGPSGPSGSSIPPEAYLESAGGGGDTTEGSGGSSPDSMVGTPNKIPGLRYAPIEPPEAGQLPDSQIPGLSERIAEIAKEPWAKDDPVRMNAAIKAARQGANQRWTESQRALKLHTEETNAVSEAQKKKYLDRFSREVVPESEILADKSLKSDAQENLIAFQRSLAKGGDPDAATDRANWGKLMKRIIAPYGTEGKITTDTEIINEAIDKNISHASMNNLVAYLDKRKTEVGVTAKALKEKAYTLYKPLVEGPGGNMALADPDREARYGNFVLALDKLVDDTQKAGKVDPSTLFTQTDPNDQWSSPVAKLAKSYASPLRPSMGPPPPAAGAPKVFNSPEEVKAEIGKSITYDDALKIISTQFGKPRAAPMQAPPYNGP